MGYIYMINRRFVHSQISSSMPAAAADLSAEPILLTTTGREPVFRIMKRVYSFLDDWKASHPDTSVLLSVDAETAKIVNSYFHEMTSGDYDNFIMKDGEVRQYLI